MSFGFMAKYRTGYYLGVRSFLLRERKSIPDRVHHINAEMTRIGVVQIKYTKVTNDDGSTRVTEQREGITVTAGSSLEKLMRAYIAQGGNPLDISMFLVPDLNRQVDPSSGTPILTAEEQPYGGVAYPESHDYHATNDGPAANGNVATQKEEEKGVAATFGEYPGGYLNLIKYPPRRLGGRIGPDEESTTLAAEFHNIRGWVNAEIRYKLHDLEARIIKLCDLREQLNLELESTLAQAWGGLVPELEDKWSDVNFVKERRVAETLLDMDRRMFLFEDDFQPSANRMLVDKDRTNLQRWTYTDDVTESMLDLMA